jgi:hypothetical protein
MVAVAVGTNLSRALHSRARIPAGVAQAVGVGPVPHGLATAAGA